MYDPKTITAEQLERLINKWAEEQPQVEYEAYNNATRKYDLKKLRDFEFEWNADNAGDHGAEIELPGLGKIEFYDTIGGEGDGKYWGAIWKLGDRFFVKDGYYSSWDSSEFDGNFHEVEEKEVVRKVWFNKGTDQEVY